MEKIEFPFLQTLSHREIDVLNLMAQGFTNPAIGQALFIDVKTVEHHMTNIYSKMKEDGDFDERDQRVIAARMYLETTGQLVTSSIQSLD